MKGWGIGACCSAIPIPIPSPISGCDGGAACISSRPFPSRDAALGATVLSAFLALNVLARYVYKKRRVSLDPRSALNHGIAERIDTVEELREFHAQEQAAVVALGEAATLRHHRAFSAELGRMDPVLARTYPHPQHKFADLI